MSPDQPAPLKKPRVGQVVYPLGEEGNSPPFVVTEKPKPRKKSSSAKAKARKRKAVRKARRKNRAA